MQLLGRAVRRAPAAALALAFVLPAAACSGRDKTGARASTVGSTRAVPPRSIIVHPVVGGTGGAPAESVRVEVTVSRAAGVSQVTFAGDASSATAAAWRAAAWSAVVAATLRTGASLRGERFTFALDGPSRARDGASAGALLTVAVIALLRGDRVRDHASLIGAIAPDGTIGPVVGAGTKATAAAAAGDTTLVVPVGESASAKSGSGAIAVHESADIDEAYQALTGRKLPADAPPAVHASAQATDRAHASVSAAIAAARAAETGIGGLTPAVRTSLAPIVAQADSGIAEARALDARGASSGAASAARQADTSATAALHAGRLVATYLADGPSAFTTQLASDAPIAGASTMLLRSLSSRAPTTLSDLSALVAAYGATVDAASLDGEAKKVLATVDPQHASAAAVPTVLTGAFLDEIASNLVGYAHDVYTSGAGLGGPTIDSHPAFAGASDAATVFAHAADAELAAFATNVVAARAAAGSISAPAEAAALAQADLDDALAQSSEATLTQLLARAHLDANASASLRLGAELARFVRAADLLDEYDDFDATFDANDDVTAVDDPAALASALTFASQRAGQSLGALTAHAVQPALAIGTFEVAGAERAGGLDAQMTALADFRSAFVASRVLALLGGLGPSGAG
jgi:hypothetical protein